MLELDKRLQERLKQLQGEFDRGQEQIALLDQKRAEVRETLLRISGAIQVLQELIETQGEPVQVAAMNAPEAG